MPNPRETQTEDKHPLDKPFKFFLKLTLVTLILLVSPLFESIQGELKAVFVAGLMTTTTITFMGMYFTSMD